jgi:histidinol-phosphate/aromatic aminotransferase/cobyric acid decarboxylase-like protein
MQSSTILLEPNNPRGPLHPERSILDLLRSNQHRYGFLYLDFADAYTLLSFVVEEE